MGRILAIDYGAKRTGLAVSDPTGAIATALGTVATHDLIPYLSSYFQQEEVDVMVVGKPLMLDGTESDTQKTHVGPAVRLLREKFPEKVIVQTDERFTSKIAFQSMIDGGLKKKDRRKKETIDQVSAVLLLQSYMQQQQFIRQRNS